MKLKHTTSLGMAAALMAKGAKLENVDKSDTKHMVFAFSDGSDPFVSNIASSTDPKGYVTTTISPDDAILENNLDVWERAWANETLEVNAVKYFSAMTRLKSIIHSA